MQYSNFGMYAIKVLLSNSSKTTLDEKNLETISNLKFIGTIQPGEKIDSKTLQVEQPGIYTSIKRFITGESRTALYEFITMTIHRIFEIINAKCNSESISDRYMCKNMINDLINSISGLKNIQKTYEKDKKFYCEIDTLIESIRAKLTELEIKHNDIFILDSNKDDHNKDTLKTSNDTPKNKK
jgi:hypothetical protein